MTFYSKEDKPFGYITYSRYGCMSHIVMNEYGVVFGCNPIKKDGKTIIYNTKNEAEMAKDSFHECVTAVVVISKFEMD